MSWTQRLDFRDGAGRRWRGELAADAAPWVASLKRLPNLYEVDVGWSTGPVALDPSDPRLSGVSEGPRRFIVSVNDAAWAEVWAMPPDSGWIPRTPRALAAHRALHRLRAHGYPGPRPLGWMASTQSGRHSFWIHTALVAPTAASCLRRGLSASELGRLRDQGASLLNRMARDGLVHRRLGTDRIRCTKDGLVLIELDDLESGPQGFAGLQTHVNRLAQDPALTEVSPWQRTRFVWRCVRGLPAARARFRRLLSG